jgi:chromosome segregation ATPase
VASGLAVGLIYGHIMLGRQEQVHQNKVNELNKKVAMLGKKASDEREALSGAEGRNRSLQAELDRLRKENGQQAEDMKKLQSDGQLLEAKLKAMTDEASQMKAARDEVSAQLAQLLQAARNLEGQAKLLAAGKQTLENSLIKVNQELDTCRSHNARLCLIADEMLTKHKSGGVVGGMVRNEPLTQIGKVELERLMQEYRDKIDQEKVKNTQ